VSAHHVGRQAALTAQASARVQRQVRVADALQVEVAGAHRSGSRNSTRMQRRSQHRHGWSLRFSTIGVSIRDCRRDQSLWLALSGKWKLM